MTFSGQARRPWMMLAKQAINGVNSGARLPTSICGSPGRGYGDLGPAILTEEPFLFLACEPVSIGELEVFFQKVQVSYWEELTEVAGQAVNKGKKGDIQGFSNRE
jgi:hypothetical protein